jgi:hypothetical protein
MEPSDRAYLSILSWPERFTHADRVESLVLAGGMDPYDAGQMARRAAPKIVQMFDAVQRDDVLGVLHQRGVLALAPTRTEMGTHPAPESPGFVTRFSGSPPRGFAVHTRDGGAWTFRPEDVRLVVAGKVRTVGRVKRHADPFGPGFTVDESRGAFANTVDLGVQLNDALDEPGGWGSNTTRNTRAVETIDLHMVVDGRVRVLRLAGGSTRIRLDTEPDKRPSLIDEHKPVEDLKGWIPDAVFDEWFPNFNTPGDVEAVAARAGQSSSRLNPVAFDFYSVWTAMLDRALRGW